MTSTTRSSFLHASLLSLALSLLGACGGGGGSGNGSGNGGNTPPSASPVLLQGDSATLAVDATVDKKPVPVASADIERGVFFTRLDVRVKSSATVGDVNAALALVNAGIVSMRRGSRAFTVAIPRPPSPEALKQVAQTLRSAPGIAFVSIAQATQPNVLPPSPAGDEAARAQLAHLLPTRFPAAWNASRLATQGCESRRVPVLVLDDFSAILPDSESQAQFRAEMPGFSLEISGADPEGSHGYHVATVLGALFNELNPTGANPFTQCLEVKGVNVSGLTSLQAHQQFVLNMPSGKFLVNYSKGYNDSCEDACTPATVELELDLPLDIALDAVDWITETASRWDDFLITIAAGNSRQDEVAAIYPGFGLAGYDNAASIAALPGLLSPPTPFAFVRDAGLWNATPAHAEFPSLAATAEDLSELASYGDKLLLDGTGPAPNVLVVGSAAPGSSAQALTESAFSESGPDVYAVGEEVYTLTGNLRGTSYTAPQAAGLASYLWLLSPDLRSRPASVTRQAIVANTQRSASGLAVIDAYASVLSLDQAVLPTPASAPVRLAILDIVPNGRFDEADLAEFVAIYFDPATGSPREPAVANYRPWDLNGDGYGGGSRRAPFDLDRVGSVQYGTTSYSTVRQQIEGGTVYFNERGLSDLQILCYYAYSPLYTGSSSERAQLLGPRCGQHAKLPATGQTECYGFIPILFRPDYTIGCGSTGQDGEWQAGVPWPAPRFTVSGDCVTDNLTGLMWWLPTDPAANPPRTWQESLDHVKTLNVCGHGGWRMPNTNELRSTLNLAFLRPFTGDNDPLQFWLNTQVGVRPVVGKVAWSSTSVASAPGIAWTMFFSAFPPVSASKSVPNFLVPVRTAFPQAPAPAFATGQTLCYDASGNLIDCAGTGQDGELRIGVPWPAPRFVAGTGDQSDCITDQLTGLTWVKAPPPNQVSWLEALAHANTLDLCGFDDWRAPNPLELVSLGNLGAPNQADWLLSQGFAVIDRMGWSSTTTNGIPVTGSATAAWLGSPAFISSFGKASWTSPSTPPNIARPLVPMWAVRGGL